LIDGKKAKGREAKAPVQITPHAEVVSDSERLLSNSHCGP